MKNLIITFLVLASINSLAEAKNSEKFLEIKTHVVKMGMGADKMYRLELREFAAVYHAEERFASCLQKSIKENKEATLRVSVQSLIVQECKVN
ncbi:MAG: hypothetical protein H7336_02440 [Bacteriovorax sp.]|nr:hypothetical protein [Bacteriovorax sp.]